jgi:hypothetical protein
MATRNRFSLVSALLLPAVLLTACEAPSEAPGLHSMMHELGTRHASVWFAGEAANWDLADYMIHELEEVVERIEDVHPVYDDVPIADMIGEMTRPRIEEIEAALDAEDQTAFMAAFDGLTQACNQCHVAARRAAIVIQRPSAPPLTNLRYRLLED